VKVEVLEEVQELLDAAVEANPNRKSHIVRKLLPELPHYVATIIRRGTAYGDNADEAFEKGWELSTKRPKPLYWIQLRWRQNCHCIVYFKGDPTVGARSMFREVLVRSVMAA
jgi:hypothetical protein